MAAVVVAATALLAAAGPVPAHAQTDRPPLVIPWIEVEPFAYPGRDGGVEGLFADLAKELARRLDLEIEFRRFDNPSAHATAQIAGETDLLPGVAALPFLRENNLFSDPLARTQVRLLVPTEAADNIDPATVTGLRIGYLPPIAGSAAEDFLTRNDAVAYHQMAIPLVHLLQGRLDGLLVPEGPMLALTRALQLDHRLKPVGEPLVVYDRVVVLSKRHADLMPAINAALADMEADGTLPRIRFKYQMNLPPPAPDVLTVGATPFAPYQVIEADGRITGFAVEALKDLAARADLKVRFVPITAEAFGAGPGADTYDMLPQTAITAERQARMDFTLPIENASWSIFAPRGQAMPQGLADLEGARIAVTANNNGRRIAETIKGARTMIVSDVGAIVDALVSGEADATIYASETFRRTLQERGLEESIGQIGVPLETTVRAPALRIGLGTVRERLNGVIPGYLVSEEYRALYEKWFGASPFWTAARLRWAFGTLALFAVLVSAFAAFQFWRRRLHERYLAEVEAANEKLDRQNAELVRLNADLARSNRELDEFAFIASHDLKEPLRGISINANLLAQNAALDEKARGRIERMIALCHKADDLVTALLQYARLGKTNDGSKPADSRKVVDDAIRLLQETIASRGGSVVVETPMPTVGISADRLAIVFRNLIINGLKYNASASPAVAVGFLPQTSVDDIQLKNAFYVRDNGIGIDPALHRKMFRFFSRLNPESEFGPGTGVGLSFVKRIVEDAGGIIICTATPGTQGTTFLFTLPVVVEQDVADKREVAA